MDRRFLVPVALLLMLGCQPQTQSLKDQATSACDQALASCADELTSKGPLYIPKVEIDQVSLQQRVDALKRWLAWQQAVALGETDLPFETSDQLISAAPIFDLEPMIAVQERIRAVQLLADTGAINDAITLSREMLRLEPSSIDLILLQSSLLTRQQRYEESSDLLVSALNRFPRVPELYNNQAANLAAKGRIGEAIEILQTAFATHPSFAQIQNNLKQLYTHTAQRALSPNETSAAPLLKPLESQFIEASDVEQPNTFPQE